MGPKRPKNWHLDHQSRGIHMILKKLGALAQAIGYITCTLLMIYGAISIFRQADSALGAPAESPAQQDAATGEVLPAAVEAASATVPTYLNYQGILRDP